MTRRAPLAAALIALAAAGCVTVDESPRRARYGDGASASAHDPSGAWPANAEYQRTRIDVTVQEAERLLAAGDVPGARKHLKELPVTELEDGRVHMLFARVAMAEGRPRDVEWHLDEASVLLPTDGRVDVMRATFREVYGQWPAARDAWSQAAAKMPDDTAPIVAQARVLLAMGRPEEAVDLLEAEMDSRPLSGELLRAAGYVKLSADRWDDAARDFRDAQDLLPPEDRDPETLYLALARAGRYDDLVTLVRDVDVESLSPLAQYVVGHAAMLADQPGLAVDALQQWITHDRSNPDAWLDLARAHFLDEQYDAAFEAVTKVLRVRPDHVDSLVLLGHIRNRVGQYAEAMATYRHAARLGADGVQLAPVMLAVVESMERQRLLAEEGPADEADDVLVARVEPRTPPRTAGPKDATTHRTAASRPAGTPPADDATPADARSLVELMAGTRRTAPRAPLVEDEPDPTGPAASRRAMPELPDAGPAPRERVHPLEALERPAADAGGDAGAGEA